jgi:hypothetical protein
MGFETLQDFERSQSEGLSRLAQTAHQINATKQNASSEANSFSAIHGTPRLLQSPKFHCLVHEIRPLNFILSWTNTFHILTPYFSKIHLNINLSPTLWSSKWSIPFRHIAWFLIPTMHSTCPNHLILHDLMRLVIRLYGEAQKTCSHKIIIFSNLHKHPRTIKQWQRSCLH